MAETDIRTRHTKTWLHVIARSNLGLPLRAWICQQYFTIKFTNLVAHDFGKSGCSLLRKLGVMQDHSCSLVAAAKFPYWVGVSHVEKPKRPRLATALFRVKTVQACLTSKLCMIRNFEVENWNFELILRNSKLKLQKVFKSCLTPILQSFVYFPNLILLAGLQIKSQSLWKGSFKEDPKTFMMFQTGVSKFQVKASFSFSKFRIRVSKLGGGTLEPFWLWD